MLAQPYKLGKTTASFAAKALEKDERFDTLRVLAREGANSEPLTIAA